jgi:hypothetical protein
MPHAYHPSAPLRAGDEVERKVLRKMAKMGLFTGDTGGDAGQFPLCDTATRVGPPIGGVLEGAKAPDALHCDRQWWDNESSSCAPFDDAAEAARQEELLEIVFPRLFFGDGGNMSQRESRAAEYRKGFVFTGASFHLGMMEAALYMHEIDWYCTCMR